MIGEDYFDLRSRLGTDLYTLASLVREAGGSDEDIQILDNLIASLNDPFVFVVVGEVNVGKSTFLNALFGADISKTGVMPTTDKICFFKYGPSVQRTPITPTMDEYRVPCDYLKDFHIVDTPGTNSIENEHQQITERFVPMADLVVFVFSAMNPWGASAWQFLDKVHRHWQKNVIFVLQQSDVRTTEEISVIRDYMKQLCAQRFQREFPIFPVSGKMAYMARSSGVDRERLLADSGFLTLESHITQVVMQSPARRTKLHAALRLAGHILTQLQERAREGSVARGRRAQLLRELETERTLQVARTQAKFEPAVDATDRDYKEASQKVVSTMQQRFTIKETFRSLKKDTRVVANLDHRLNQDLLAASSERWKAMAMTMDEDLQRFGTFVSKQWLGEFYLHERPEVAIDDPEHAHRRFKSKLESALRRLVIGIRINEVLEPAAALSVRRAKHIPWVAAVLLLLTVVTFFLASPLAGFILLGASVLGILFSFLLLRMTLRKATRELASQLEAARPVLRTMIKDQLTEETHIAFSAYDKVLNQPDATSSPHHATEAQLSALAASLKTVKEALDAPPRS